MKKWTALLLSVLLLFCCSGAMALQVSTVQWMQMDSIPQQPMALCRIRALDNAGKPVITSEGSFNFVAHAPDNAAEIDMPAQPIEESAFGHILVVDMSLYFSSFKQITASSLQMILKEYINAQPEEHRFKFLLANASAVIDSQEASEKQFQGYMDRERALEYVDKYVVMDKVKSSRILNALYMAMQQAPVVRDDEPMFKSVFAVMDPDLASNDSVGARTIADSVSLRQESDINYDVLIAAIYRDKYMNSDAVNREVLENLKTGYAQLQGMAESMGGAYAQIYHISETEMDCGEMKQQLASLRGTSHGFLLDYSGLAGHMGAGERLQSVRVTAFCTAGDTLVSSDMDLKVDTQALPEVLTTPAPVLAPQPVVAMWDSGETVRQVVERLKILGYLEMNGDYGMFDDACYNAYLSFCLYNNLQARHPEGEVNGVYQEGYDLLMSDAAVPHPTPTPVPGPQPVVPVGGKGDAARLVMVRLNELGYLADSSEHEAFDGACYDAYLSFCMKNNVQSRDPAGELDGVYEAGYNLLMSAAAMPYATPTPEPTPTPAPTIPDAGYTLGDMDTDTSGGFIAAVQAELQRLNCFSAEAAPTVGKMDQATLDAIGVYCAAYGWNNERVGGVNRTLCEIILRDGPNLAPYVWPQPGLREKVLAFMVQDMFMVGDFMVKAWMLCAACGALLLLLLILLIILLHRRGGEQADGNEQVPPTDNPKVPPQREPKPAGGASPDLPATSAMDNRVAAMLSPTFVTLRIEYNGKQTLQKLELSNTGCCTIGRRNSAMQTDVILDAADVEISRRHAALYNVAGQIFLTDLGSVNGTRLNGTLLKGAKENERRAGGCPLKNGDVAQIGKHRITFIL